MQPTKGENPEGCSADIDGGHMADDTLPPHVVHMSAMEVWYIVIAADVGHIFASDVSQTSLFGFSPQEFWFVIEFWPRYLQQGWVASDDSTNICTILWSQTKWVMTPSTKLTDRWRCLHSTTIVKLFLSEENMCPSRLCEISEQSVISDGRTDGQSNPSPVS